MTRELPQRLNCTRCNEFKGYQRKGRSVYCWDCGKKHSTDSLHVIRLDKKYKRSDDGILMEETP